MYRSSSLQTGHAPGGRRGALELMRALSRRERRELHSAGRAALEATQAFLQQGKTVISEVIGQTPYVEWAHYPEHDAKTPTGALFYYHAHAARQRIAGEHGHFHIFAANRRAGCPPDQRYTHIVGVSVDDRGMPIRLFTTNQWVTAECWEDAARVCALARRARLKTTPAHAVGEWLDAVLAFFRPQIDDILYLRDARIRELTGRGRSHLLEDRRSHILSQCRIDFSTQILALEELGGYTP